ncbi:helix-turn-helix transcriptional regulator [uncultured Oscillibacter sp.]|uniref:helix-turn-helix domain-containing protein n=2 Tax=Oscillibacter TaxID=459786 RepID=UPI002D7EBF18|nr:helix-turn-helix transcriptional regulator [uncultured Oscillibacter sp.]
MGGDGLDAQKQIKKLMEERSWTDYRLAKESGLSHSTVTNMFDRNNTPTLPTLEAVCRAFGITLAQFFQRETHWNRPGNSRFCLRNGVLWPTEKPASRIDGHNAKSRRFYRKNLRGFCLFHPSISLPF